MIEKQIPYLQHNLRKKSNNPRFQGERLVVDNKSCYFTNKIQQMAQCRQASNAFRRESETSCFHAATTTVLNIACSPLTNSTCVKPLLCKEDATSLTTPTKVEGDSVTVPANDP